MLSEISRGGKKKKKNNLEKKRTKTFTWLQTIDCLPVNIFWKAVSTFVESKADVSINDKLFFSEMRKTTKKHEHGAESNICEWISLPIYYTCILTGIAFYKLLFSNQIQSTLVISNSKGLYETVRDIRTSTYQICRLRKTINRTTTFNRMNM